METKVKNLLKPLTALSLGFLFSCSTPSTEICKDRLEFKTPQKIKFDGNENLLLCGDPKTESWKHIPLAQAEFDLKAYLSSRAYFEPRFEYKNDKLYVDPGKITLSTELKFLDAPPGFDEVRMRDVIHEPLNTALLNKINEWTTGRLRDLGYACPEIKVQAVEETGVITVTIKRGFLYSFGKVTMVDSLNLFPESYRRFDAFNTGQRYDQRLSKLTTSRSEIDGIVVSGQMLQRCPEDIPSTTSDTFILLPLREKVLGGDKHNLSLGAGASTEEIPIVQAKWKSVRLDPFGSNFTFSAYASQLIQKLQFTYNKYPLRYVPRFSLNPAISYEHDNELTYEFNQFQVNVPFTYKAEYDNSSLATSFGPAASRVFSIVNNNTINNAFLGGIGDILFMTHDFELYQSDPRSGTRLEFNIQILSPWPTVDPVATVFQLNGTHLINLVPVSPHQWVLGFRYGLATTLTNVQPETDTTLPAQYFHTLGGDANLRGYGRNEINNNTVGALSSVFLNTEIRYAKTLPLYMEPFLFFDIGALGQEPFGINGAVYTSPGIGMRLGTPFGSIRTTLAHGYIWNDANANPNLEHLQFFISFGSEF